MKSFPAQSLTGSVFQLSTGQCNFGIPTSHTTLVGGGGKNYSQFELRFTGLWMKIKETMEKANVSSPRKKDASGI